MPFPLPTNKRENLTAGWTRIIGIRAKGRRGEWCAKGSEIKYEVFFVEDNERIVVLAVFHAKRNPKRWQERS